MRILIAEDEVEIARALNSLRENIQTVILKYIKIGYL